MMTLELLEKLESKIQNAIDTIALLQINRRAPTMAISP